jgi:putative SOS response-associated peptidase YedK
MCGRFTLRTTRQELAELFDVPAAEIPETPPRYNIAPTQDVTAVRAAGAGGELVHLRWGLVPAWAKDKGIGYKLINARADTVADKPSFRSALVVGDVELVEEFAGLHLASGRL